MGHNSGKCSLPRSRFLLHLITRSAAWARHGASPLLHQPVNESPQQASSGNHKGFRPDHEDQVRTGRSLSTKKQPCIGALNKHIEKEW